MVQGERHADLRHEPEASDLILANGEREVVDLHLFRWCHLRVSSSRGVAHTAQLSAADKVGSAIGVSLHGMSTLAIFVGVDVTVVHSGMSAVAAISAGGASALTYALFVIFLVSFSATRGRSGPSESSPCTEQGTHDERKYLEQVEGSPEDTT